MLQVVYNPCLHLPGFIVPTDDIRQIGLEHIVRNHIKLHITDDDIDFYIVHNGKILRSSDFGGLEIEGNIEIVPCLRGGKGGFGSMLRAIGAQIEKTTNREACRDLSGRRLRDINEEKRLKKWISEQAEREKQAAEKKKRKLRKLCVEPKHEFSDPTYDKERSEMPEKVHSAVEEGLKTSDGSNEPCSSKSESSSKPKKKKIRGALWVDGLDELEDTDSDDSSVESPKKRIKLST